MVVVFLRTVDSGSEEVARVELRDGKLSGPKAYVKLLDNLSEDPARAMRQAPERLSGSYLQASLIE